MPLRRIPARYTARGFILKKVLRLVRPGSTGCARDWLPVLQVGPALSVGKHNPSLAAQRTGVGGALRDSRVWEENKARSLPGGRIQVEIVGSEPLARLHKQKPVARSEERRGRKEGRYRG